MNKLICCPLSFPRTKDVNIWSDVAQWWPFTHTQTLRHSHILSFSQNHCCCWRNRSTWLPRRPHSPCCDPVAPGRSRCRGEEEATPLRHRRTARGSEESRRLREQGGETEVNLWIHKSTPNRLSGVYVGHWQPNRFIHHSKHQYNLMITKH